MFLLIIVEFEAWNISRLLAMTEIIKLLDLLTFFIIFPNEILTGAAPSNSSLGDMPYKESYEFIIIFFDW